MEYAIRIIMHAGLCPNRRWQHCPADKCTVRQPDYLPSAWWNTYDKQNFNNNHYWIMSIWNLKYETWKCNTSLIKIYDRIVNIYKWQSPCPDCPRWFLCQYYGPGTQGISSSKNHLLTFFCGTHKDLFIPECLSCFQLITTKRFIRSSHKAIVWFQKTWIILHASYWLLLWCCFCL